MTNPGATLATAYAKKSKQIGMKLVTDKVAFAEKDVIPFFWLVFSMPTGRLTIIWIKNFKNYSYVKIEKKNIFVAGYNTISMGTGRKEFIQKRNVPV